MGRLRGRRGGVCEGYGRVVCYTEFVYTGRREWVGEIGSEREEFAPAIVASWVLAPSLVAVPEQLMMANLHVHLTVYRLVLPRLEDRLKLHRCQHDAGNRKHHVLRREGRTVSPRFRRRRGSCAYLGNKVCCHQVCERAESTVSATRPRQVRARRRTCVVLPALGTEYLRVGDLYR